MSDLTTQTIVSDGTLDEVGVTLDFIDRSYIHVYFDGFEAAESSSLWNWVGSSNFIAFTPAVGFGVTLTIKRITPIDELLHDYSEGAQFRADVLDESFLQVLHAAQEFEAVTVSPSDDDPLPVGPVASPGISDEYARADHVHVGGSGSGGGGTGTDGFSSGIVYAYQRSHTMPTGTPGEVTYDFSSHTVTIPAGNVLLNGWTKAIPEGDAPLYVTVATASNQTVTDVIGTSEWAAPAIMSKDGMNGLNVATVYIYQRTVTNVAPSNPTTPTSYNFTTGVASGMDAGWQGTVPPSFSGPYLWVNTATASSVSSTDTIAAIEWAGGQILAQDGIDGGSGGVDGLSNATFYAYKRATSTPTDNPGIVTYHFPSASITTPAGDALANGWTKTHPVGTNPIYVTVATASSNTTTDSVGAAEWSAPQLLTANGITVAPVFGYQRTASNSAPALPSATVTYNFNTSVATGFNNGWTQNVPTSGGDYLWITQATAAAPYGAGTDTIPSSEWAAVKLLSQNGTSGTNGTNGQRGTVNIPVIISGTAWSNSSANAGIAAAGYGAPQNRDIVTEYNLAGTFTQTRFYDSGTWAVLTAYIDGNLLVTGTLSADKITSGTLDSVQIVAGSGHTPGGYALEISPTGVLYVDNILGGVLVGDNFDYPSLEAGVIGTGYNASKAGVYGLGAIGEGAHGVRGKGAISAGNVTSGIVGGYNGYDFYAEGDGTNYGPFTGAHDALSPNSDGFIPDGDIVVDVECVGRRGISNTIFTVARSSSAMQPAIGVKAASAGALSAHFPAALVQERTDDGYVMQPAYHTLKDTHNLVNMNAVGEGQINVTGEGGNITAGDYICTSSTPGKGMRQADDLCHNYTVAKARESVTFEPGEVRQIACIYMCG